VLEDSEACGEYQLVAGVPAQLNAMLSAGLIDVCPSSSIEYARNPEQYLILPRLSISSVGAVGSVLLFSPVPLEELDKRTVLLSSESATSVNLLKILLEKHFGCSCDYTVHTGSFDDALRKSSALLLIGDAALRASLVKHGLYVYDLGALWHDWTGLPFVFALWLCRREVAQEHFSEMVELATSLVALKEVARKNLLSIAARSPEALWMGADRLVAYWRENISYELDDDHLKGLALFYTYCTELGLLKADPELRFLTVPSHKEP
jgi:chorismate dehydratase